MITIENIDYSAGTQETLPSAGLKINTNFANVANALGTLDIQSNTSATAAPAVTDDSAAGYEAKSFWLDTTNERVYICVDATEGAAVWVEVTNTDSQTVSDDDLSGKLLTDFEQDVANTTGLTFAYSGGKLRNDNIVYVVASGTFLLNASVTSYVEISPTGIVSANEAGFNSGYIPLFEVVTGTTSITSVNDVRAWVSVGGNSTTLNNDTATTDPTATDDSAAGYEIGSRWINTTTGDLFRLIDATEGAAVWAKTTHTQDLWISRHKATTHNFTTDADYALTATQEIYGRIILTDTTPVLTAARSVIVSTDERPYVIQNDTAQTLTVKTSAGTGVDVAAGSVGLVQCDEANVIPHGAPVGERLATTADISSITLNESDIVDLDKYSQSEVDSLLSVKLEDAPTDGKQYVRKDGQWVVLEETDTTSEDSEEGEDSEEDFDSGTGPQEMIAYDETTDTGYYGEVTADEFFTGDGLHTETGLSAGDDHNPTAGWLKFYVGPDAACNRDPDKRAYLAYVAKKSLRYGLSWDDINAVNLVYGDVSVSYGDHVYQCRLLSGADRDPSTFDSGSCADNAGVNSEWNMLLYRVHQDIPDCSDPTISMPDGDEDNRHGGPQNGSNWDNFTNSDLNTDGGVGRSTWCQEIDGTDSSNRVRRGYLGVAYFNTATASATNADRGYRPVLVRYV